MQCSRQAGCMIEKMQARRDDARLDEVREKMVEYNDAVEYPKQSRLRSQPEHPHLAHRPLHR